MKLEDIAFIVYDVEVFLHDWLVVFKERYSNEYTCIWNDRDSLEEYLNDNEDAVFVGFNNKHYDQYIIKGILKGLKPEEIKELSDDIVAGYDEPCTHPLIEHTYLKMQQCDMRNDTQRDLSLKALEGHLHFNVLESSVDFNYPEKLTYEQQKEVTEYCKHDVYATSEFFKIRRSYLETKLQLAEICDCDPIKALNMTDPKLAALLFKATPFTSDKRHYTPPDVIKSEYIPHEVLEFFKQINDDKIPDDELFSRNLTYAIGGCEMVYAYGGLHGALPTYEERQSDKRVIVNYDVSSLYPSIMINFDMVSRAIPSKETFSSIRNMRFEAKHTGDTATADALKSPLNKCYGAMKNQYNDLYDPNNQLAVCVTGQLLITMLISRYVDIDTVKIIQVNTDGVMLSVDKTHLEEVEAVNKWWCDLTQLELERDDIEVIVQKDVNNYAMRKTNGKEKVKGIALSRGINAIGAWSINNNATIIASALKDFLLNGTPPEQTISSCKNWCKFQFIAKAGSKYDSAYHVVNDEKIPVQKCNRVFATTDENQGKLYKVKKDTGQIAKIENLPEHCMIGNNVDEIDITKIDKSYYIDRVYKLAETFKKGQKMTTKQKQEPEQEQDVRSLNVYQKLMLAREEISQLGIKKTGTNDVQEYDYFELKDIVPIQLKVFKKYGLLEQFSMCSESTDVYLERNLTKTTPAHALASVINVDKPEEVISFSASWGTVPPIISKKTGREVNTDIQRKGAEQTYMRRYLKLMVLDLAEKDTVDTEDTDDSEPKVTTLHKPTTPATPEQRKKILANETNSQADNLQLKALKALIKKLNTEYKTTAPEITKYISELAIATDKLTHSKDDKDKPFSKIECEKAIQDLGKMRDEHEKGQK